MDADPFQYPPLVIPSFIEIQVTAVPGIKNIRILLKQVTDVIYLPPGMEAVSLKFYRMVKNTMSRRSPAQMTDHAVLREFPGIADKRPMVVRRIRPVS